MPGVCYSALRRLPRRDSHPLEKNDARQTAFSLSHHDAPCTHCRVWRHPQSPDVRLPLSVDTPHPCALEQARICSTDGKNKSGGYSFVRSRGRRGLDGAPGSL